MAEEEIILRGKFENGKLIVDTTKKINDNLDKMGKNAQQTQKQSNSLLSTLKKLAAVVGIGLVARQFKNLVSGSLQAAGAMEQVDIALTTMLGSAEEAKDLTKDLITFAKKTPFEIEGIFGTTKRLIAYGVAQEDVIDTMTSLGNISAGVGTDLEGLAYGFGKVKAAGKLTAEVLNIFTDRGVPLVEGLAKALNKTTKEINAMEKSSISFEVVKSALEGMSKEGGRFFNLMDKQSASFLGTVSNMADSFYQVKIALGNALMPVAHKVVNAMIVWLGSLKTVIEDNQKAITDFANAALKAMGVFGAAFKFAMGFITLFADGVKAVLKLPLVKEVLSAAAAIFIFSKGLGALTIAFRILTASAGLWIVATIAVVSAIGYLSRGIENMPDIVKIAVLNMLKSFNQLKFAVFGIISKILEAMSSLSSIPGFGWIENAKKKFESLKDSIIDDVEQINNAIGEIKGGSISVETSGAEAEEPKDQTVQQNLLSADPAAADEARLKAAQEENAGLLEEQRNYLEGYLANQTETDLLLAENKTLRMQESLLQDEEFALAKEELGQQLLENEITSEEYKAELEALNREARNQALQIQYETELALYEANEALMNETKNEIQLEQDEIELEQLQLKLQSQTKLQQAASRRLVATKSQQNEETYESKKKTEVKTLKHTMKMDTDGYKAAKGAADELVGLQNSKNKSLAAIGKAAAMFQIVNDTARGAMSAYASLAPIPIVGPGLGIAAASAVIAYGAERLSTAASNSFAVGTPNIPQDQLANVHKGEMIIPATFSEAIRSGDVSLSSSDSTDSESGVYAPITNININFDGAQFVGDMNDDDIVMIGERLGEMIVENTIPAIPTRSSS